MKRLIIGFFFLALGASYPAYATGIQQCYTTNGDNCISISPDTPLPVGGATANPTNITTNADTNIKSSPGMLVGIVVNTAGTTSNVKIYNDADGTCSSGLIGTFSTLAQTVLNLNITMSVGICAKTAGGAAADITILYR